MNNSNPNTPRGRGRGRGKPTQTTGPVGSTPATPQQNPTPINSPQNQNEQKSPQRNVPTGRGRGRAQHKKPGADEPAQQTPSPEKEPLANQVAELQIAPKYDANGKIINPWTSKNKTLELMHRKDYGVEGKPIDLYTNFYEINHKPTMKIHQYEITIEIPEKILKSNKSLAVDIFNRMVSDYRDVYFTGIHPVFDGSRIMYTNKRIPNLDKMIQLPVKFQSNITRLEAINIQIRPTQGVIEFSEIEKVYKNETKDLPYNLFSCADIILGFMPKMSYVSYGRNYFPRGQTVADLGNGIQLWSGSVMAVKPGQWKLLVNIDEKHTAFYKEQSLKDFLTSIYPNRQSFKSFEISKINDHLKGLQVQVTHNGHPRKHRVVALKEEPANKHLMTDNNTGLKMTIESYFKKNKDITLQFPQLPCVQVEPKNRDIYLPVELCTIVEGQRCIRSLSEKQIADIIRTSAKRPDVKKRNIDSAAKKLIDSSYELAKSYGLELSDRPMKVKGRVLQAPNLNYGNGSVTASAGQWRGKRMKTSRSLTNWGLMSMASKDRFDPRKFKNDLAKEGSNMGIIFSDPVVVRYVEERNFLRIGEEIIEQHKNLQYMFVILPPNTNNNTYSMVKEMEVSSGVLTQCIRLDTYQKKFKPQTLGNILLKTNTKLGGVNWELAYNMSPLANQMGKFVFSEPVMIVGADVTHWARDEGNKPSIAGVVCTLDRACSKYASRIRLQHHKRNRTSDEIIRDFKEIMKELLIEFRITSKRKPSKILYYRDGVSQGQFIQTLTEEIAGIQAACKELEPDYQPKITYINAQKRHHTRLYCAEPRDTDRSGNVPAGTVVDREITNPIHFDFYLNSHSGIQGTNRPCHYTVLYDDSDMSPDMVQLLTFYLCHTYARCSRSVSYPAPTYYAHLLCARARTMLSAMRLNWFDAAKPPNLSQIEYKLAQHKNLKNISYFV